MGWLSEQLGLTIMLMLRPLCTVHWYAVTLDIALVCLFISGFGAGNKMLDPYVIFNFILSCNLAFVLSTYPVLIMVMPLNMILVMYIIPCILLSYDF